VAINKIDLPEARANLPRLRAALEGRDEVERVFAVSGVTGEGMPELLLAVAARLRELPRLIELLPAEEHRTYTLDEVDENHWEAERLSKHHYAVRGVKLERTLKMTDFRNEEAAERFQRILKGAGVSSRLEELGIELGDIVHIADSELVWDEAALQAEQAVGGGTRRKTHKQRLREQYGEVKKKRKS
jgi:GTP-binding protein